MNDVKQEKSTRQPHRWKKGESGNPHGRPPVPEIEQLRTAIRIARKRNGNRDLLVHFVERAYVNDMVLIALLKKLLPDKTSGELKGEGFGNTAIHIYPNKTLVFKDLKQENADANITRTDNLYVPEGTKSNSTESKI
jgi:hypothetical protein